MTFQWILPLKNMTFQYEVEIEFMTFTHFSRAFSLFVVFCPEQI